MKKIKILIFGIVMMMTLCVISLAYDVGDVISAGISGYCVQCNEGGGTHTASGVPTQAGLTAAVSYSGITPDLKYGTVVYIESINRSVVIVDCGSNRRGGEVGVEPFCFSHGQEEYSITTPNGQPTTIKILFIPNEKTIYQNAMAGLNFLKNMNATSEGILPSGTINENLCTTCGVIIRDSWLDDKQGNHYKQCENGHTIKVGAHNDVSLDVKCDVCNLDMPCYACKSPLLSGWYNGGDDYHYKICANTHYSYPNPHIFNNGKCDVCNYSNTLEYTEGFYDLPTSHWAYDYVIEAKSLGLINGRPGGYFAPEDNITVEEFIRLLSRVAVKKGQETADGDVYLSQDIASYFNGGNDSYKEYKELMKVIGKKLGETSNVGKQVIINIFASEINFKNRCKTPITKEEALAFIGYIIEDDEKNNVSVNVHNITDWDDVTFTLRGRINRAITYGFASVGTNITPKSPLNRCEATKLLLSLYKLI